MNSTAQTQRCGRPSAALFTILAILTLFAIPAKPARADTATWLGGSGNWNDPTQWLSTTGTDFPDDGNSGQNWDAAIASGSSTVNVPITIENFTLTGGVVTSSSNLTVNQLFTWTGGTLLGTGTFYAAGGITIDSGTVAGTPPVLSQATLINAAGQTATFTADSVNAMGLENGAVFNNQGAFLAQNNQGIIVTGLTGTGGSLFNNTGTFTRNSGTGTFIIGPNVTFNNTGTVNAQTGTLDLQGGDNGSTTGAFNVSSGAALQFDGTYTFAPSSAFIGAGTISFASGAIALSSSSAISDTTEFSGATVTISGSEAFSGPISWTAGTIMGSGTAFANNGLSIAGAVTLSQASLANGPASSGTIGSTASLELENNAILINSGTLVALGNQPISALSIDNTSFVNNGLFIYDSNSGVFDIGPGLNFINTGTVDVQAGTLTLQSGGATAGTYIIGQGADLQLLGNYYLSAPSSFSGAGTLDFSTVTLVGASNFNSTITMTGSGSWAAGMLTFSGSGVTMDASNSSDGEFQLNNETLTVASAKSAIFTGTGNFDLGTGATIINNGTFVAQNNQSINDLLGGGGIFKNNGTFTRTGGTGTFTVASGVSFINNGTVNAQTGTLDFQGGDNGSTTGAFNVSSGAVLQFDGTYSFAPPSAFTGAGAVDFATGAITLSSTSAISDTANLNGATVTVSGNQTFNAPLNWNAGTVMGSGTAFANNSLTINSAVTLSHATLVNGPAASGTLGSTANLQLVNNATFLNSGTFLALSTQPISGPSHGGTFDNTGLFLYDPASGTFTVGPGIKFINSGTVDVQNGTFAVQSDGNSSGNFIVNSGAVLQFLDNYTLTAPSTIGGLGTFNFNNVSLSGTSTFNSALTMTGVGTWEGGTLTFTSAGLTMDASTSAAGEFQLNRSTLTVASGKTVTFAGTGDFELANGASIVNDGTFVAQNNQTINNNMDGGGTLLNQGLFTRTTGTGTFDIAAGITVNNPGTISVQSGTLEIDGSIVQQSGNTLTGGAWVIANGTTLLFNNGGQLFTINNGDVTLGGPTAVFTPINSITDNTGAFRLLGHRNFTYAGNFLNSGTLQLAGGTFTDTNLISGSGAQLIGYGTFDDPIQMNAGMSVAVTTPATTLTINGVISGTGSSLTVSGPGTLVLPDHDTYTGGTTLNSGFLDMGNAFSLGPANESLAVNGGTLDLRGFSLAVSSLSGTPGGIITSSSAGAITLTDNSAASTYYGGTIKNGSAQISLVKNGAGTLTLAGASNYTGGTTLNMGGLQLGNNGGLGAASGNVVLNAGTLDLHGFSPTVGSLTGSSGALITNLANTTSALSISGTAATTYPGSITAAPGNISLFVNAGSLTLTGNDDIGGNLSVATPATVQISGGVLSGAGGVISGATTVTGFGSEWMSTGNVNIGSSAGATLAITGGGIVSDGTANIGNTPGTNGAVTISGLGSTWINSDLLVVGASGSGSLVITGEATVTDGTGGIIGQHGTGSVTVSGNGSQWTNSQNLYVGETGTGTMLIDNGGSVSVSESTYIGSTALGAGSVTVSGSGSGFTDTMGMAVGGGGKGTLEIDSGGLVSIGVGSDIFGGGTVTVSGSGSALTDTAGLTISGGTLAINGAGAVSNAEGDITGNGSVTVSGTGSRWTCNQVLVVGDIASIGTLSITNGGVVLANQGSVLGNEVRGTGTVTVSGSGSAFETAGDLVVGGRQSVGTVNVSSGGLVSVTGNTYIATDGGNAHATVSGTGSAWTTAGELYLGNQGGKGNLAITDGGLVSDFSSESNASVITVSGSGSKWINANLLEIGFLNGTSTLAITGGAIVSDSYGLLGNGANNVGNVTVSGSGSTWTTTQNLTIGKSGTGTVTVTNGAAVTVNGSTTISNIGTLQLDGSSNFTTASLTVNGGTIRTLGALTFANPIALENGGLNVDTDGFNSTFTGKLSGTGGLDKIGFGTLTLSGSDNYSGGTTIALGSLQLGSNFAIEAPTGSLTLATATLDMHGFSAAVGPLTGNGASLITSLVSGTSTLSVNSNLNTTYQGRLNGGSGVLNLVTSGSGILTLIGASTLGGSFTAEGPGGVLISSAGSITDTSGVAGYNGGTVTVSGAGSAWSNSTTLYIGQSGSGTLNVASGAVVSDSNGFLGDQSGATGAATISGAGSKWTNSGTLQIGILGTGTLSITGGATVSDAVGYLGDQSAGSATVSGTGSVWTSTGGLYIGDSGTAAIGALTVASGGAISSGSASYLGFGTGSSGAVTVSGSGSKWTNTGTLAIGNLGSGTLTITGGAAVSVTGATTIGSAGTLQLDALSTFTTGSLAANGGTILALGSFSSPLSATLGAGGVKLNSNGFNPTFTGIFSGAGGIAKSGLGNLTLTGSSTYTGPTSVTAATLSLTTGANHTAALGNTAITVASGANLDPTLAATHFSSIVSIGATGTGSGGASITLTPGSAFRMAGSPLLTVDLNQGSAFTGPAFTIGGASGIAPLLTFSIGNAAAGTDLIDITKTVSVLATGGKITVSALAADTTLTPGNYDLITAAGGFTGTAGNGLSLTSSTIALDGTTYDLTLANSTTTAEVLTVTEAPSTSKPTAESLHSTSRVTLEEPASDFSPAAPISALSAPTDLAKPPITAAAVPEPADWASLLAPLAALLMLARRSRVRRRA